MRTKKGRASYTHEKAIIDYLEELREKGWKTINLKGKSPDGIAVKNNHLVAIEILTYNKDNSNTRHAKKYNARKKKEDYFMFDDVYVKYVEKEINGE